MLITPISCVLKISLLEMVRYFLPSNRSCTSPYCRLVDGCQWWPTKGWEFIKEKNESEQKKVNTHVSTQKRTRSRKHALVQANTHSYKKVSTQKRTRARKRARKHEFMFAWTRACFLTRVLFFVDARVFSCFLTFFFSFINSQPCLLLAKAAAMS